LDAFTASPAGPFTAVLAPFLAQLPETFWMPSQASTVAREVDVVFYLIYWISVFFFALIVGLMAWFVVRYRRRRPHDAAQPSPAHSTSLEIAWTAIPVVVSVLLFVVGFKSYMNMVTPPRGAYEISVIGQKWNWLFTYPNGYVSDELHVPVDRPVLLTMTSEDVIHSLWIPAFRIKMDVVPGRYTRTWFEAHTPGTYPLLCTEYCGVGHSDMLSSVIVHPGGRFETWLESASNLLDTMPPAEAGELLARRLGCIACHSLDGSPGIGPTFVDLYGSEVRTREGASLIADANYVRESIVDPMAVLVAGYDPVMPTYAGRIKDQEITSIIAYLRSLSRHAGSEPAVDEAGTEPATTPTEER
jgi:cytochrome c oxidase subunit II